MHPGIDGEAAPIDGPVMDSVGLLAISAGAVLAPLPVGLAGPIAGPADR